MCTYSFGCGEGGLYDLFRKSGMAPHVAIQRVGARKAGTEEAEWLEIEPGDAVLTVPARRPLVSYAP